MVGAHTPVSTDLLRPCSIVVGVMPLSLSLSLSLCVCAFITRPFFSIVFKVAPNSDPRCCPWLSVCLARTRRIAQAGEGGVEVYFGFSAAVNMRGDRETKRLTGESERSKQNKTRLCVYSLPLWHEREQEDRTRETSFTVRPRNVRAQEEANHTTPLESTKR